MIRFYMDENVPGTITRGLLRRGVDVITAQEDGCDSTPDPQVLDRATELDRVLFTHDDDLLVEARSIEIQDHLIFVRRAIRDAGPLVTALLVARISHDAQELFRALIGDEAMGLRWAPDYEILLLENGRERGLEPIAGSERVAAALAVRLALLQNMGDVRFAFFDEPTVHLDQERRDRLVERLMGLRCFDQLFVISHDDAFERNTDHVVQVEKPGDHSVVTTS